MSDYFLALTDHYRAVRARLNAGPPPPPPPPASEPDAPAPPAPDEGQADLAHLSCSPETKRCIAGILSEHGMLWGDAMRYINRAEHVRVRAAIYIALRTRGWSFPRIGALCGGRDHTTIINSVQRYQQRKGKKR